jgi:hypothetical protein
VEADEVALDTICIVITPAAFEAIKAAAIAINTNERRTAAMCD